MTAPPNDDMQDLMPGLMEHPLWEGRDDEFAAYVYETFGIPTSIDVITITPRSSRGRWAVAIGGAEGAIVFIVTPDSKSQQTRIAPYVMGPLVSKADVVARAKAWKGENNIRAVTAMATRHLPVDVALDLFAPPRPHETRTTLTSVRRAPS
jgi:hypothetical protein